ncbi:MAG: TetR family transcriptional regulator, partial [Acidimicrobiales bacterium]
MAHVVASQGYEATTVGDIVRAAGVARREASVVAGQEVRHDRVVEARPLQHAAHLGQFAGHGEARTDR